jgi:hypothetical protein
MDIRKYIPLTNVHEYPAGAVLDSAHSGESQYPPMGIFPARTGTANARVSARAHRRDLIFFM